MPSRSRPACSPQLSPLEVPGDSMRSSTPDDHAPLAEWELNLLSTQGPAPPPPSRASSSQPEPTRQLVADAAGEIPPALKLPAAHRREAVDAPPIVRLDSWIERDFEDESTPVRHKFRECVRRVCDRVRHEAKKAAVEEMEEAGKAVEVAPQWADAFSDTMNFEEKARSMEIAAGAVADMAVKAVRAYLGDFIGVQGLVDTLRTQVITMGWKSAESDERKAMVKFDEEQGTYAVLVLERLKSERDSKGTIFTVPSRTAKLRVVFRKARAKNAAARHKCQELVNRHVQGLLDIAELDRVFQ